MCVGAAPVLGMVLGAAQAVVGFGAQQADYDAKSAAWKQNVVNAQAEARDQYRQITNRELQEQGKFVQQRHISLMEQADKKAQAEVGAVSAGGTGMSLDNILTDITSRSAQNRTAMDRNLMFVSMDLQEQRREATQKMQSRIDSMPRPQSPSPFSAILGVAGAGVKYMSTTSV